MDEKKLTPMKAIRAKCLDCSNGSANEVKLCPIVRCPLYAYRFGKNPNRQREYTEEEKDALLARISRSKLREEDE